MEKKLILKLNNHDIYYIKDDFVNYYITIPKNYDKTNICIELKNKMDNYNIELNDEVWVMENIKSTYSYIDEYNITLVIPILSEESISILEKIDSTKFDKIDVILGKTINSSYNTLKNFNKDIEKQVVLVDNERYKTFINWFTTRYTNRVICKKLLEIIQFYNATATSYKKLETPVMNFVIGSYNTEIDAPAKTEKSYEKTPIKSQKVSPAASSGFTSYWLLAIITIIVASVVAFIAFHYK